ncbi:MAG: pyridoxamine 5'-phosphate oxidase family protein [Clostridia bacterium]|nr:pyridoxamine 5'-phosphate oxidase family protein [Clostridia bacterium]
MKEIYDFLKESGVYYLATVDGDQPRVRPFGTIELYNGKLYIQTGRVKAASAQMKKNPKIEISAMLGDRWIRISAEAVLDESISAQEHLLTAYPSLQGMYKAGDGNTEVFYLQNGTAEISSFSAAPKRISF